ncbi:XRE family transcriptional regulator [Leptotrichia sp. OH3620_COT-345]|uniref:helix-turn-helix domain-containing protein n=1 Tax=Leptotrichia sp. OH3620_COT-345 TaxID=2491048 RepID=UPI000F64BBBC|nr:helix-turn-helix transcriptional regulator [Leptotrichia sp. OH3620_COT-345]RRD40386.1 XRE family transcriptional regulator [Leptotrichia sp. OH3620_COT-345]
MDKHIGLKILRLRENKKLSQQQLAKKLSVKPQTIYKYENGIIKNIKYETIEKLAKIFNVSPQYLLGLDDEENIVPTKEELERGSMLFYQNKKISDEDKDELFKKIQEYYFKERLKK